MVSGLLKLFYWCCIMSRFEAKMELDTTEGNKIIKTLQYPA